MTLSIGLKSGDPARKWAKGGTQFVGGEGRGGASKNIGRSVDSVVHSSQRWPDDQNDRYLLSISSFHFFYPKNFLPPPVRRARFVVASFMLQEFLLFTSSRRSRAFLAANRLVVRLSVA